jgi:hypothetical protein
MRGVQNLFSRTVVISLEESSRPALVGIPGGKYEALPTKLSKINWESHVLSINRVLPAIVTGDIPGWVCASCSNWEKPAAFPGIPAGLLPKKNEQSRGRTVDA